jgi:hypothetical protein
MATEIIQEFQRGWDAALRAARSWHEAQQSKRCFRLGAAGFRRIWSERLRSIGGQPN